MRVLVSAASRHGSTAEIAAAIGDELRARGLDVTVLAPEFVGNVREFDAVVLGSAVYTGHWLDPASEFVARSEAALSSRPVWLFSSGPVGDPSRKLVEKMGGDPVELPELRERTRAREHRVFPGKLDGSKLSLPQRLACMLFRFGGDFRDWPAIRRWAAEIAAGLQPQPTRVRSSSREPV